MRRIRVSLKDRPYNIVIGPGLLKRIGVLLRNLRLGTDGIVVTNRRLMYLYGSAVERALHHAGFSVKFEIVPDSEKAKSAKVAFDLMERIGTYDKHKEIFIIALGGGVIGDLAGFTAAVYKRGVAYIQIPTTLLAQVDSAIGGKVAIDLPIAKNLIGAFYQPKIVVSDTSVLRTLSPRQVRNGLAEIIKYGVIKDRPFFLSLEAGYRKILDLEGRALEQVVSRCSAIKAGIVIKDEFDKKGVRTILNLGHTLGHAVEAAAGYSSKYSHGESVALGMIMACRISSLCGMMREDEADRVESLIERTGLSTRICGLKFSAIYESHLHDKKFMRKRNRFILPVRIGSVKAVEGLDDRIIKKVLREHLI